MTWWRRKKREEDLEREIADHLEMEAMERQQLGASPDEARSAARRLFGNSTLVKEEVRRAWGWMWLDRFWQDVRYGARGLYKSPMFTLVSMSSLAIGIGATVTASGVFEAVFLNAVTARNVDRVKLVEIGGQQRFSYRYFEGMSVTDPALAGLAAYDEMNLTLRSGNGMRNVVGDVVSGNFFSILGVSAMIGRTFTQEEGEARNQPSTVILSHGFWKREFNADTNVLGQVMEVNREPFTIIGVLPQDYRSIHGYGITPDIYVSMNPLVLGGLDDPANARLRLICRLRDGVSIFQAESAIRASAQVWRRQYPAETFTSDQVRLAPLTGIERMRNDGVPIEVALFFAFLILAGGLVLLIACGNVGGLLLARGASRSRELAVRLALGAPRYRLVQQLVTESLLLAVLGAGSGIALYLFSSALLDRIRIGFSLPLELHLSLDARTVVVTIMLTLLATLLSGLIPALQAGKAHSHIGSRQFGGTRRSLRQGLVVGQFALAFVLLVSAALLLRSLARIVNVDPGFDATHLLTAEAALDPRAYPQEQAEQYFRAAMAEIERLPGVKSVSGTTTVPLGLEHNVMSMKAGEHIIPRVFVNSVTPDNFRTMRIKLLYGRGFKVTDRAGSAPVAIVNQTFARRYLNGRGVNSQVQVPILGQPPTFVGVQVIGVVADSKYGTLGEDPAPALYWPWSQRYGPLVLEVNSDVPPTGQETAVQQTLEKLNGHVPIKVQLMQDRIGRSLLPSRIATALLGIIGALGLILAAIGIYGVMAYSVGQRVAEIGVRLALGATRRQVLQMILTDAFWLVFVGLLLGSGLAMIVTRMLSGVLAAGLSVSDPLSIGAVALLLSAIGLIAALLPAWRASLVDPTVALRYE